MVLEVPKPWTNEPISNELCDGHVSYDWELIGYGFIGECDPIVLDATRQVLVLLVRDIPMVFVF